jgi:1-deoxy-D-xylulose-5-phosphate reductoisomerase
VIGITVLGSTGSIGVSTLDVVSRHPDRYRVVALTAHRDVAGMTEQCRRFRPHYAAMADPAAARKLRSELARSCEATEVLAGPDALVEVSRLGDADVVMAAIVGAAGLMPTLAAVCAGKRVLLANKEALVVAGAIVMKAAEKHRATLLPIDSEHNAIFQCLPPPDGRSLDQLGVERILLTASGGPFRSTPVESLATMTPEQACAHPNWAMGRKISVDSATMMNKGLEVIEACWLFATDPNHIQVVIHPQSVIHSMVQYADGSVLAQLGNPDMRTPIANALAWPSRIMSGVAPLDIFAVGRLDFEPPSPQRFPCLRLAQQAAAEGGTAPVVLNAANEVAVAAFLDGRIRFPAIADVVSDALEQLPAEPVASSSGADGLDHVLAIDARARTLAERAAEARAG